MTDATVRSLLRASLLCATTLASAAAIAAPPTNIAGDDGTLPLPTGQYVTPQAVPGFNQQDLNPGLADHPSFVAGEAVQARLSPDGATLAVITAGYNNLAAASGAADPAAFTQYIFLYDVSGANKTAPALKQVIHQTNSHVGLVWSGSNTLYAAGGSDDAVYVYAGAGAGAFAQTAKIALGHAKGVGLNVGKNASGLALSADGKTLVVANNFNDSISVIDTASNTVRYEQDLRPYANEGAAGVAGGEYPIAVAIKGGTAYVGAYRDREVVVVDVSGAAANPAVTRIKLDGNPNGMTFDAAQANLYVAQDNADEVAVIATATNTVTANVDTRAPAALLTGPRYTGASPFAVTISGGVLYAVNDGSNSIAVIPLAGAAAGTVTGLIPTAYAPKDVAFSADGAQMYIVNGKSDQGPNPRQLTGATSLLADTTYPGGNAAAALAANAANEYQFKLEHATLVSAPVPAAAALATLTAQVARNNFYTASLSTAEQAQVAALQSQIKHVIYVVKENRTFDQVLGDLSNGANGDATLTVFGRLITPNFHKIASNFVTLDNFFDAADGSMDGWSLATRGLVTTTEQLSQQINYGGHGLSYESEGSNRNVPVGVPTAGRDAATNGAFSLLSAALPGGPANLMPGPANVSSHDAPFGIQQGFIYDAVLHAGGTVRNYGFLVNNIGAISNAAEPGGFVHPGPDGANVVQVAPLDPNLLGLTDVYFRGFDQNVPDLWRFNEWNREFQGYIAAGSLPSLETVRLSHDHMGSFATAQAGITTPERQQADDDFAVGKLVDAVAHSPFASSTLIIVTEDDSQDGPDHIDSHRTTAYMVGPYVRKHAVVSARYSQVSVLRTIEDVLGAPHINLNTAYQRPMLEAFDTSATNAAWTYSVLASTVLKSTGLMLSLNETGVSYAEGPDVVPTHDAAYWAKATEHFDFSDADRIPYDLFNKVLLDGMKGGQASAPRGDRHAELATGAAAD